VEASGGRVFCPTGWWSFYLTAVAPYTLFAFVACHNFQSLTICKELGIAVLQPVFENIPIVAGVFGVTQNRHNIHSRKPPFVANIIPNSTYFLVVKKSNGYFVHLNLQNQSTQYKKPVFQNIATPHYSP
jgi:hypothetical protein